MGQRDARTKPDYGFDGSPIRLPLICLAAWALCLPMLGSAILSIKVLGVIPLVCSLVLTLLTIKMFHYVHIGKLRLRDRLLALAGFQGHETVLDVGTGRGLLMIAAARMLPNGKSVGIDIWSQEDMKDNNPKDTLRNAELEGVLGRVELKNEDARKMTFPDASFDVALSNLCLHNIPSKEGREMACREIARVLKPHGTAVIGDMLHLDDYARVFAEEGFAVEITTPPFLEASTPWHKVLKASRN